MSRDDTGSALIEGLGEVYGNTIDYELESEPVTSVTLSHVSPDELDNKTNSMAIMHTGSAPVTESSVRTGLEKRERMTIEKEKKVLANAQASLDGSYHKFDSIEKPGSNVRDKAKDIIEGIP